MNPQQTPRSSRDYNGADIALDEERRESLEEEFRSTIEEARMVLPGVQALFGFQLIAVFSDQFRALPPSSVDVHIGSLLLVAVSIALIMTPAAYHRIAQRGWISRSFCRLSSRLIAMAMVVLSIGICLEIYVVVRASTYSFVAARALGLGAMATFVALWLVYPFVAKVSRWKRTLRKL